MTVEHARLNHVGRFICISSDLILAMLLRRAKRNLTGGSVAGADFTTTTYYWSNKERND